MEHAVRGDIEAFLNLFERVIVVEWVAGSVGKPAVTILWGQTGRLMLFVIFGIILKGHGEGSQG